jgi:hypothetical protein
VSAPRRAGWIPWLLLGLAALLLLAAGLMHLTGAREQTAFLLGDPTTDPIAGGLYLVSWLGAVLVAPALVAAAGWFVVLDRLVHRRD